MSENPMLEEEIKKKRAEQLKNGELPFHLYLNV